MWHLFSQRFTRTIASVLIASFVLAPVALAPRPVAAQGLPVIDAGNLVANTGTWLEGKVSAVMNTLSAATLKTLGLKEWTLDGVLFALAKKALQQMVRSTIAWINSGFKGSPMYITNPEQFLMNIGDQIAGDIIYGSELNFLCSPIDIRIALEFYYTKSRGGRIPQCTLTKVVGNVDQFLEGNFMAGGWPGFLALSISPTSQPLGGVIAATAALEARVGSAQGSQVMRLNWGSGFLSWEECTDKKDKSTCQIMTPGKTIADALTFELSTGERTLIEADEINELIGALFAQLGSQALAGLRGVRGISQSGYTFGGGGGYSDSVPSYCSSLSYLDQLDDPSCNPNLGGTFGTSTIPGDGASFIAEALTAERNFQSLYRAVADRAANAVEDAEAAGLECTANANVAERATDIGALAEEQLASSTERVLRLQALDEDYRTGTGEEQVAAVEEYLQLQSEGVIRSDITNAVEQRTIDTINTEIDTLRNRIETCRADEGSGDLVPVTYYLEELGPLLTLSGNPDAIYYADSIDGSYRNELPLVQASVSTSYPNSSPQVTSYTGALAIVAQAARTQTNEQQYLYVVKNGQGELHTLASGGETTAAIAAADIDRALDDNPSRLVHIHTHPQAHAGVLAPPSPLDFDVAYKGRDLPIEWVAVDGGGNAWAFANNSSSYTGIITDYRTKVATLLAERTVARAHAQSISAASTDVQRMRAVIGTVTRAANGEFGSDAENRGRKVQATAVYGYVRDYESKIPNLTEADVTNMLAFHRRYGGTVTRTRT